MAKAKRLFGGSVHNALIHAATQYDIRQSTKPGYNAYALAQYFGRIEETERDIANGATLRAALVAAFHGPLLNALLRGVNQPKLGAEEKQFGRVVYIPASDITNASTH